jgi:hypothetical protein
MPGMQARSQEVLRQKDVPDMLLEKEERGPELERIKV